jgi:LacI family transcriptional regulator
MPTISDVAKRARVSTYTVSAVLNRSARVSPELTGRVMKAVQELDYTINYVARSLQTRKTETLGMLLPDIGNPFYSKVVRGVEEVCAKHNYSLLLSSTYENVGEQNRGLLSYRAKQVDGILLFVVDGDESGLKSIVGKNIPVVCVGRRPLTVATDTVVVDNKLGAKQAVEHLVSKGRKRIAFLTGTSGLSVTREAVAGWRLAYRQAGLTPDKALLREGDWTEESGYVHTLELMRSVNAPDAFLVASLIMLNGVLRALRELKKHVPADVDVMSTDDADWLDVCEPRISVVEQPRHDLGVRAAEMLFERIAQPKRDVVSVVLKPALKLR